jgi:hypothetical protein
LNTNDKQRTQKKIFVDKTKAAIKVTMGGNEGAHTGGREAMQMAGGEFVCSRPLAKLLFREVSILGRRAGVNMLHHTVNCCGFI